MIDIKLYNSLKRKYPNIRPYNYLYKDIDIYKLVGNVCCKHCHTYEVESESLFLNNTLVGNLIDYKFYGNSEVRIGKNKLNIDESVTFTLNWNENRYIKAGNYVISYESETHEGDNYPCVVFYDEDNETVAYYLLWDDNPKSITLSSDIYRVEIFSNGFNYEASIGVSATINKLMLSETGGAYEPYQETTVKLGDKTKNLFTTAYYDYSSGGGTYEALTSNSFKQIGSSTWNAVTFMIDGLEVGTQYTVSCDATNTKYISVKDQDYTTIMESPYNITFTATTSKTYISFYSSLGTAIEYNNTYSNIQLEEAASASTFEPFGYKIPIKTYGKNLLENNFDMLPSIATEETDGTVIFNGTLSENTWCGLRSLTLPPGTYIFSHNKTFDNESYFLVNGLSTSDGPLTFTLTEVTTFVVGLVLLADTYTNESMKLQIEVGSTSSQYEKYAAPTVTNIYIDNQLETEDDYIDYGNQLIIIDDVEETITLPDIPTLDGRTNYIVNTEIQPSSTYVKYYSSERG